jgi:hypothetical protein
VTVGEIPAGMIELADRHGRARAEASRQQGAARLTHSGDLSGRFDPLGRVAELIVAAEFGLPEPPVEGTYKTTPDVGPLEVQAVTSVEHRLLIRPSDGEALERIYVLVMVAWPGRYQLLGWLRGRDAAAMAALTRLGRPEAEPCWAISQRQLRGFDDPEFLAELADWRAANTSREESEGMTQTEDEQAVASAIAVRESSGAAIIKAVPIPEQLQQLGVRIAEEEGTGLRVIVLPPDVRQAVNLLTPVSSWAQADPNWTPSVSLVKLDKDAHTYGLPGGKLGLNKQALETLGKCAGVLYTRTSRVPKQELQEGEMWAYRATVGFRRSDGTIDEVTRERGFNREAEQLDITTAVRTGSRSKGWSRDAQDAEIQKRWIAELRFGPAKTESKAINRALRAGLAIPSSVAEGALAKPFLVVGFNFTPDYDDPAVKQALVAVAMNAEQAIYGGRQVSEDMPEHGAADIPLAALEAGEEAVGQAETPAADSEPEIGGGAAGASSAPTDGAPAADTGEPELEEQQPEPEAEPEPAAPRRGGLRVPEPVIVAAGNVQATKAGKSIAEVVELAQTESGGKAVEWLAWAKNDLPDEDELAQAVALYASARIPELWAQL